jgi:hypothetical protein
MVAYREASFEQATNVCPDDVPYGFQKIDGDVV